MYLAKYLHNNVKHPPNSIFVFDLHVFLKLFLFLVVSEKEKTHDGIGK